MEVEEWWSIITPFLPSIPNGLRLAVVRSKLRGDARALNARSLDDLKQVLLVNYPSARLKVTALTSLKQTYGQPVQDFFRKFSVLKDRLTNNDQKFNDEQLAALFIDGLQTEIKREVIRQGVTTLANALEAARCVEESLAYPISVVKEKDDQEMELVNQVQQKINTGKTGETKTYRTKRLNPSGCLICGRTNHATEECYSQLKCLFCEKTGHLVADCRALKRIKVAEKTNPVIDRSTYKLSDVEIEKIATLVSKKINIDNNNSNNDINNSNSSNSNTSQNTTNNNRKSSYHSNYSSSNNVNTSDDDSL